MDNNKVDEDKLAEELVVSLERPDGSLALRPVHSLGIGTTGIFEPSPIAKNYCTAEHFQGDSVPVTVRFSNGSGSATRHDGWSDVRGMATRFHLKKKAATDLIAMTLPEFFSPDGESFLDFAIAAKPKPYSRETPLRKMLDYLSLKVPERNPYPKETISPDAGAKDYANKHKFAQLAVFNAANIGAPVSYARASYHAVHSFIVTGPDHTRRWVRFNWQPIAGVLNTNPMEPPEDNYLDTEMHNRLTGQGTARFGLNMSIGEIGDDVNDCTRPWPPHRVRVVMGTLTLDTVVSEAEQKDQIEKMSFNPWLLTDGIDPSDDPVLRIRHEAYKISSKKRGGTACPFGKG